MSDAEKYLRNPENPNILEIRYLSEKRRLFIGNDRNGPIYMFKKKSRTKGYEFKDLGHISKIYPSKTDEELKVSMELKLVCKYKKEAALASFTNPFIRKCLSADENKSLYENGVTTGNKIDGKIITLDAIEKYAGTYIINEFRKALREKRRYSSGGFNFLNYDGSLKISIAVEDDTYHKAGDVMGYFNKEYKDCANGYYYLLINDEKLIGYDVD